MEVSVFFNRSVCLVAHTKWMKKMAIFLTEVRFLLFSQWCILRNTVDLLNFMLHTVLSITSVETFGVITFFLPDWQTAKLTCGSFQLYIRRLNLWHTLSLISPRYKKVGLVLTEDMIIESEPKETSENKIFSRKVLQRVNFWAYLVCSLPTFHPVM